MGEEEITIVHKYLMKEWKINEKAGKRGPRGLTGHAGKPGENASYYSQYFQHSKTEWDIDFKPNFWIDGYDIEENPSFKVP